jgi:hypothetical protein
MASMQVPAAIQKLTHSQEKALLSRAGGAARPAQQADAPAPPWPSPRRTSSLEDERGHARLQRECEAFRVELAFLDRRVAVFGLHKSVLITHAQILRAVAHKIASWRGDAMDRLVSLSDEQLTAERMAEAMKRRNDESTNRYYRSRLTDDHLRIVFAICSAAAVALLPFILLPGNVRMLGPVLLFGVLGSSFSAVHALIKGETDSMIPNVFVMLTPVLFGPVAGLAGFGIHEYLSGLFNFPQPHWGAMLALSFLFGMLGQRIPARFAVQNRRKKFRPAQ